MYFFFVDDSIQNNPSRPGMSPMVAIGGLRVCADNVGDLEKNIQEICKDNAFPRDEEFKWSPGRELWMRENLVDIKREQFFISILNVIKEYDATITVVLEDINCKPAVSSCKSSHEDVVLLFLERVQRQLERIDADGVIIIDRPSGNRSNEDAFLFNTLESIQEGTRFVEMGKIALNVLSTSSKFIRLLQVADLVTSCTTAYICGENFYSPPIFQHVLPLLDKYDQRIGGFGLKIHPDYKFINLYHWLLSDDTCNKGYVEISLPNGEFPYANSERDY